MKRSEIREYAYIQLGDKWKDKGQIAPTTFSEARLNIEIEVATNEVLNLLNSRKRADNASTFTVNVVSGTREYDLDAALASAGTTLTFSDIYVIDAERSSGGTARPTKFLFREGGDYRNVRGTVNYAELLGEDVEGVTLASPIAYLRDKYLGFWETPTENYAVTVHYRASSFKYTDDNTEPTSIIPRSFHPLIALYAARNLLPAEGTEGLGEFRQRIANYENQIIHRPKRVSASGSARTFLKL